MVFSPELDVLLFKGEDLAFLVGAGISIDPPANLSSARKITEALVDFACWPAVKYNILTIPTLRYEYVVEIFRDVLDKELKFIEYFETSKNPNGIHRFLARRMKIGNPIITTNFDNLIEEAARLEHCEYQAIITETDFLKHSAFDQIQNAQRCTLTKLHGSRRNIVTDEDTKSSIITTLDGLGKGKVGNYFSVGPFKRKFLEGILTGRVLIIMGYSGGDDFDIMPTIALLNQLKAIIWINHNNDPSAELKYEYITPSKKQEHNRFELGENAILNFLAEEKLPIYRITGNTAKIIKQMEKLCNGQKTETLDDAKNTVILDPNPDTTLDAYKNSIEIKRLYPQEELNDGIANCSVGNETNPRMWMEYNLPKPPQLFNVIFLPEFYGIMDFMNWHY